MDAPATGRDFHFAISHAELALLICLDTYILIAVYKECAVRFRDHCRAEPARDPQSPAVVGAVGGRDRASAVHAAAYRVETPARASGRRLRGGHRGCAATRVPVET